MELKNKNDLLILDDDNGSILSYRVGEKEFIAKNAEKRALFTLKLLNETGDSFYCNAHEAEAMTVNKIKDGYLLIYEKLKDTDIRAEVLVKIRDDGGFAWHISVDNKSDMYLEWVEFPLIAVPDLLKGSGGNYELFWPAMEGQIIEDCSLRDKLWFAYDEIGGQSGGYCGFYPGACPMQFMAYYNSDGGIYFAAHDGNRNPKSIEYYKTNDGIVLEYRLFCEGAKGYFDSGYDMIMTSFLGDWYDAADIYRTWMEQNIDMPSKIYENNSLPDWYADSPVVVVYPIRGTKDHGDMTPNMYYPYNNILPIAEEFSKKTDSRIMTLPMHWEGTSPWAPPYVWPPYGGSEEFCEFVNKVHSQGNLVGVYCSGIGWTTKSFLNPEFDMSDKYDEKLICKTPEGKIEQSKVLGEPIRLGYDMCPQSTEVDEIVTGEIVSIAKSGCDYTQYFDQNLGGNSCFCYAHDHGHPSAPGAWQNKAMTRIFNSIHKALKNENSEMLIGCEGAASEPFIGHLPFNDLRYNIGFLFAKPVPAYAYVFHEYINNFMGNQNTIHEALDLSKNPDCLLFRIAYSFVAGDMLTVALGDKAQIHWGWDVDWDTDYPNQENVFTLIRNLNAFRRSYREFLHEGKMIKPLPIEGADTFTLHLKSGYETNYPSLLTSRWRDKHGNEKQVIVNFLNCEQRCMIEYNKNGVYEKNERKSITVPPLDAVWI